VTQDTYAIEIFLTCYKAIIDGKLITRGSAGDKEFHFQNWFTERLAESGILYDQSGRNTYPDFTMVHKPEGYEVKGLAFPGREASYDANSQVPTGFHNGRTIFYLFGRYPAARGEREYPVVDLVLCHSDFLNAHHEYSHKNKSVKGFGSYGDILIRDRKMYVAPTPYAVAQGTTGRRTLILPSDVEVDDRIEAVGQLIRSEAAQLVVGYRFNLTTNDLTPEYIPNPNVGKAHPFTAYRVRGEAGPAVTLASALPLFADEEDE
jgi:hypothetical protein